MSSVVIGNHRVPLGAQGVLFVVLQPLLGRSAVPRCPPRHLSACRQSRKAGRTQPMKAAFKIPFHFSSHSLHISYLHPRYNVVAGIYPSSVVLSPAPGCPSLECSTADELIGSLDLTHASLVSLCQRRIKKKKKGYPAKNHRLHRCLPLHLGILRG